MLVSLSTLLHGTLHEKLIWTFRLYDLNGDGVITKTEMGNMVVAVYELMGIILKPPGSKNKNIGFGTTIDRKSMTNDKRKCRYGKWTEHMYNRQIV